MGGAACKRHHPFICLRDTGGAPPTRLKCDAHLQGCAVGVCSTCHDGLLVPVARDCPWGSLYGAVPRATRPHSWGAMVSVECSSRTLPACWQLCRKCIHPTLRCSLPRGPYFALFHHAGLEKLREEAQDVPVGNLARHQLEDKVVRDAVKEPFEISIHHHALSLPVQLDELRHGRVATATPAKAMRVVMKGRFEERFDQGTNDLLCHSTPYGGDA